MKIQDILLSESSMQAYRDLSHIQTSVLQRLVAGATTYETASPREQAVIDELVDFGLVSDLSFEPTQRGAVVANLATKHGSRDGREVQRRSAALGIKPFDKDRSYSNNGDIGDIAGEEVADISSGARSIDRGAIVR